MSSKWLIGKVEDCMESRDGKVRKVLIGYKYDTEQGERLFRTVERPVRECVKLYNIEDTSLFEDIARVREISKKILSCDVSWYVPEVEEDVRGFLHTVGCNTVLSNVPESFTAADFGYLVQTEFGNDVGHEHVLEGETEIGAELNQNVIFMIDKNHILHLTVKFDMSQA